MTETQRLADIPLVCRLRVDRVTLSGCKETYKIVGKLRVDDNTFCPPQTSLELRKGGNFEWTKRRGDGLLNLNLSSERNLTLTCDFTRKDGIQGALFGKGICTVSLPTD